jgi:hypothetical protein
MRIRDVTTRHGSSNSMFGIQITDQCESIHIKIKKTACLCKNLYVCFYKSVLLNMMLIEKIKKINKNNNTVSGLSSVTNKNR